MTRVCCPCVEAWLTLTTKASRFVPSRVTSYAPGVVVGVTAGAVARDLARGGHDRRGRLGGGLGRRPETAEAQRNQAQRDRESARRDTVHRPYRIQAEQNHADTNRAYPRR